ncbi:MAG: Spo0B C-terminal domain-containing protein [Ectobacillus sp.]
MDKKWTIVDALRHSRHDWLNRLQLIKAHLSLGGVERVQELMEEFVGEAHQESRLMNLKMPLFTELLLTYSWEHPPCTLEYEVLGEIHTLTELDEVLTKWTSHFMSLLHREADLYGENHLCITIACEEDVRFFFDFRGKLMNTDKIEHWLAYEQEGNISLSYSVSEDELSIEMQVKQ